MVLPTGSAPLRPGDKVIGTDAQGVDIISRRPDNEPVSKNHSGGSSSSNSGPLLPPGSAPVREQDTVIGTDAQGYAIISRGPTTPEPRPELPAGSRLREGSAPLSYGDKVIGTDAQGYAIVSRNPLPSDRADVQEFVKQARTQGYSNADIANVAIQGGVLLPSQSSITQQQVAADKAAGLNNAEILARSSGLAYTPPAPEAPTYYTPELTPQGTPYNTYTENLNKRTSEQGFVDSLIKATKPEWTGNETGAETFFKMGKATAAAYPLIVRGGVRAAGDMAVGVASLIATSRGGAAALIDLGKKQYDDLTSGKVTNAIKNFQEESPAEFLGAFGFNTAATVGELPGVPVPKTLRDLATPSTKSPEGSLFRPKVKAGETEVIGERELFQTKTNKPQGAAAEEAGIIRQTSQLREGEVGTLTTTRTPVTVTSLGVDFKLSYLETRPTVVKPQNTFDLTGTAGNADLVGQAKQVSRSGTYRPTNTAVVDTASISSEGATIITDTMSANQIRNANIEAVSTSIATGQKAALAKETSAATMINIIEDTAKAKELKNAFAYPKPKKPVVAKFPNLTRQKPVQVQTTASKGMFKQTSKTSATIKATELSRVETATSTRQLEPRRTVTEIKTGEDEGLTVFQKQTGATVRNPNKLASGQTTVKLPPRQVTTVKTVSTPKPGYPGKARITESKILEGGSSEQVISVKTRNEAKQIDEPFTVTKTENLYSTTAASGTENTIKYLTTDAPETVTRVKGEIGKGEIQPYKETAQTRRFRERQAAKEMQDVRGRAAYRNAREQAQAVTPTRIRQTSERDLFKRDRELTKLNQDITQQLGGKTTQQKQIEYLEEGFTEKAKPQAQPKPKRQELTQEEVNARANKAAEDFKQRLETEQGLSEKVEKLKQFAKEAEADKARQAKAKKKPAEESFNTDGKQQTVFAEPEPAQATGQAYDAANSLLLKQNLPDVELVKPTFATPQTITPQAKPSIYQGIKSWFTSKPETKAPIQFKPAAIQSTPQASAPIQVIKPATGSPLRVSPSSKVNQDNAQIQKPASEQIQRQSSSSILKQEQIQQQKIEQIQRAETPQRPIPTRVPTIIDRINKYDEPVPPLVVIGGKGNQTTKKKKGFNVFARRQGRFVKITNSPLTEDEALNYGAFDVKNTSDATFKLVEAKTEATPGKFTLVESLKNLYRKGDLYIQPRNQRIKTKGEKEQITLKGIRTNLSKGYVGRFNRRTTKR